MLEVRLLGAFEIECDGKPITLPSRFAQSLFAYLILNPATPHRREKLAGLLWPDSSEERARASLRHELWRIRKALASTSAKDALLADEISVAFAPSVGYAADVQRLAQMAEDAAIPELTSGLQVYRGELLPGFYDEWLVVEREHLQLIFEQHLERLLRLLEGERRWAEMIDWAERWLSLGQNPEAAYRALMLAHAGLGDRAKVLAAYERCTQALHALGLEPSEELRALTAIQLPTSSLPSPLTSFIGRQREVKQISDLLLASRFVTLTGAGGVGKTRLAIEVARAAAGRFPDGVWYLDLAPVQDPELVPGMLLSLLRISGRMEEPQNVMDLLTAHFRSLHALIVLDNCEHLVDACAKLATSLLGPCPALQVLATSRQTLRAAGETVYRVPCLTVPATDEASVAVLAKCDSVTLFVERARLHASAFTLGPENAGSIAWICRHLDGIPLAIELAAGRIGALTVDSIRDHLSERFELLTGGPRTGLPRHRTLRALIDWSHDLLSHPEQVLLRRLSAFAGGWRLEAAQDIAGTGELQPADVLRLLPELVDKSLVGFDSASARYSMLESIREYSLEKLKAAREEAEVRSRHLDYWLALTAALNLGAIWDEASLSSLVSEMDNLLTAIRWCDHAPGGAQKGLELIAATRQYWDYVSMTKSAYPMARHVVDLPGAQARTLARVRALQTMAQYGYFLGQAADVRGALDESLEIATEIGDPRGMAVALQWLASVHIRLGDDRTALDCFEKAYPLLSQVDQGPALTVLLNNWGEALRAVGDLEAAEAKYEESLSYSRREQNPFYLTFPLLSLARILIARGSYPAAGERLRAAMAEIARLQAPRIPRLQFEEICAGLAAACQEWRRAVRLFGAAQSERERITEPRSRADEQFIAPWMTHARAALGEKAYEAAYAEGSRLGVVGAFAEAQTWLQSENRAFRPSD